MFGERIGLRLEGRVYGTFTSSSGAIFSGGGGCSFGFTGSNVFWQFEATAGIVIEF
jgi:hypothetical protein